MLDQIGVKELQPDDLDQFFSKSLQIDGVTVWIRMPFSAWNNAQKAAVWRFGPIYFQRALVWWSGFHCILSNFSRKILIDHLNPILFEVSRLASFDQATFKWLRLDVFGSSYVQSAAAWQFKPCYFQRVAAWGLEAILSRGLSLMIWTNIISSKVCS